MIKFEFEYDGQPIATIHDLSRLFNKNAWKMFEEAVTQQVKSDLLSRLEDIRDRLENEGVTITYNFKPEIQDFQRLYSAAPELTDLIGDRLK